MSMVAVRPSVSALFDLGCYDCLSGVQGARNVTFMNLQTLKAVKIVQTGFLMFAFYQLLTRSYKGVGVAQLPFEPFPIIRMLSHRGLPEDSDPRLLSVVRPA
jgi:hypothetical protein